MYRIFIVEDEQKIASALASHMAKYGYEPRTAARWEDLKSELLEFEPHLVLLDIHLPQYDGFYWCRQFRAVSHAPIVFLSARSGEMDQVMAIENGGDDYLTKPFNLDLVMAKIKSQLRRAYGEYAPAPANAAQAAGGSGGEAERSAGGQQSISANGLTVDRAKFAAIYRGNPVSLSKTELQLLDALVSAHGSVVSRETLLELLWDDASFVDDNTLTVNVTRVRRKLEELGLAEVIETIRGHGYRLRIPAAAAADGKRG